MTVRRGIDVSYAQGNIAFGRIDKNEVEFAIVRSSYGWQSGQKDSKFDRNIKGFHEREIPCGAYHYSYAQSKEDAFKEAEYCLHCLKGTQLELPVFYDLENSSIARHGRQVCTEIAIAFCERIKRDGRRAGIYMNPNWLENYVDKDELLGRYELWLAQWDTPKPSFRCSLWQYRVAPYGTVRGIDGEVDLDYMYLPDEKTEKEQPQSDEHSDRSPRRDDDSHDKADSRVVPAPADQTDTPAPPPEEHKPRADSPAKKDIRPHRRHIYTYIIRQGDSLSSIAARFDTTVEKIMQDNHLDRYDEVYAGRILRIAVAE